jgi:hypothetical protein
MNEALHATGDELAEGAFERSFSRLHIDQAERALL